MSLPGSALFSYFKMLVSQGYTRQTLIKRAAVEMQLTESTIENYLVNWYKVGGSIPNAKVGRPKEGQPSKSKPASSVAARRLVSGQLSIQQKSKKATVKESLMLISTIAEPTKENILNCLVSSGLTVTVARSRYAIWLSTQAKD